MKKKSRYRVLVQTTPVVHRRTAESLPAIDPEIERMIRRIEAAQIEEWKRRRDGDTP
jgi:hypothetical protein